MNSLTKLLREQSRAYICGALGHAWHFILPVQKRDPTREVLASCTTCHEEAWVELPPDGYALFLADLAAGKIN